MNRDLSILQSTMLSATRLLTIAFLMTMPLTTPAAGQSPSVDRSADRLLRQQGSPFSSSFSQNRADSPRTARPSRSITPRRNSTASSSERVGNKGKPTTTFWKTAGALAVVVVLILAIGRILSKRGGGIGNSLPTEAVELLGRKQIDQRQTIHLVRLGSRILVLGSSADGLRSLAEINDPVEIDYLAGLCRSADSSQGITQTFRNLLTRQQHSVNDEVPSDFDGGSSLSKRDRAERFSDNASLQHDLQHSAESHQSSR